MDTAVKPKRSFLSTIAPGILVAATGVGAGDLMTAGFAGSKYGLVIAWAALAGAVLKWVLNEGVARWQMATGTTLLEGWSDRLGAWIRWTFFIYLLIWSVVTAAALISACGVAGYGLLTPNADAQTARRYWGIAHSVIGVVLVFAGGYRLFEKMMALFIAVMFVAVIATAVLIRPDMGALATGLFMPRIPTDPDALGWTLGIIGGVGGTVTLLCYGYWIREEGRSGIEGVRACRFDLAIGYVMTALFGIAMIVIGSRVQLAGKGAEVAPILASKLGETLGPVGRWAFLIGFWGAVFSSLLGVWQSVPYLFADFVHIHRHAKQQQDGVERATIDYTKTKSYRGFLIALAILPLPLAARKVEHIQLTYAVLGAMFMPLLAITLLIMNNRRSWVGDRFRTGWLLNGLIAVTLGFFLWTGVSTIYDQLSAPARPKDSATATKQPVQ